ncbi:uncharacterized protein [Physcomitrium patens]|uniref:Bet v I/Major latex protein domain-containing protein n=1 Tax=Physcomitrium patens TaxID=3218 RepID=A0A2K1K073_PHYPA|nr:lachrymatory-factor synthase-like [Physcomitrium patens]PNR47176.1 hypothetical protein PHYPA_014296 [Physcomitrium patens]|eukprot:XP_024387718.1 lachrymatory-factor synthase-like [Physcomitrella patens]
MSEQQQQHESGSDSPASEGVAAHSNSMASKEVMPDSNSFTSEEVKPGDSANAETYSLPSSEVSPQDKSEESTQPSKERWSGGVHLTLDCNVDAAWSLQSDFLGLVKWVPTISICSHEAGPYNDVGCVRYCKGSGTTWVYERLLEMDHAQKYMSYIMEKNQFVFRDGFQDYIAKVQLGDAGEGKTWVKWTYEVDPVATQTLESLTTFMTKFYTSNLEFLKEGANKTKPSRRIAQRIWQQSMCCRARSLF